MKKLIFGIWLLFFLSELCSQQELTLTQFSYNKQNYNPAFVAEENIFQATMIFRDQWAGLEGAPNTQILGLEFPITKLKIGLGLNFSQESIGIQKRTNLQSNYRYRIKMNKAILQFGMSISFRNYVNDFTDDRLNAIDGFDLDNAIQRERLTQGSFNVGAGIKYEIDGYYIGFSLPRLIKNQISPSDIRMNTEEYHAYFLIGRRISLTELWSLSPELLVKYNANSPIEFDLHAETMYNDQFLLGLNYRAGGGKGSFAESIALVAGVQVSGSALFGLAYDIGTSQFRDVHNGSFEFFIRYRNNQKKKLFEEIINPRYF